jgi:Rrf2 family protein
MRISAKGRYALASVVFMAQQHESGEYITILSISEKLGISKIYLEQVFSLLKRGNIVNSIKGAMGGYQLTRMPQQITVLDVLKAVELSLFEPAQDTVSENSPEIEAALRLSAFDVLDKVIQDSLCKVSLLDIVNEAEKHKGEEAIMYYI